LQAGRVFGKLVCVVICVATLFCGLLSGLSVFPRLT